MVVMMEYTSQAIILLCFTSFISSLVSGSIHHLPRQTASEDIDFTNFPTCAGTCLTRYRSLGCSTPITKDCYCGKPNPLECAWKNDLNVDQDCWNRTEDWYATQCPSVKAIDVESIPSCAVQCFEDTKTNLCLEYTKNCVCSNGKPSCSSSSCNATELAAYDSWYAGECLYNLTETTTSSSSSYSTSATTVTPSTSTATATSTPAGEPGSSSVSTGTIVGASIGGLAGTIIIGALAFFAYRHGKKTPEAQQADVPQKPPVHHTGGTPVRPMSELVGSTVMPGITPIEAPANPHIPPPIYEKD